MDPWIEEFFARVGELPAHQRAGQWAFNLLYELRPDLANKVRATNHDPFYDNRRIAGFIRWLLEQE